MPLLEDDDDIIPQSERVRRERDQAKRDNERLLKRYEELEHKCDLLTAIDATRTGTPKWLTPPSKTSKGKPRAIANTISSDQHFDEVVNPAEVGNTNAYSRRIAQMRLERHFEKFVTLGREHLGGHQYDGAHIWWNGDAFSGNIHDELVKTNDGYSILDSVEYWIDPVVNVFRYAADGYGKVHVSFRRGNHTRTSKRVPAKRRVVESYDWLFGRLIQRELSGDKRFTFDIPINDDGEIITHYSTRYLATHGDQFNGGSGISGIFTPLSLGAYRKSRRQSSIDEPFDIMVLGHFHQYLTMPNIIVNGSLKGTDEYAWTSNFGHAEPEQAFWLSTPEHGPSFHVPIRPMDRKREGW